MIRHRPPTLCSLALLSLFGAAAFDAPLAAAALSREALWLRDYLRVDTTNPATAESSTLGSNTSSPAPGEAAAAELLARILRQAGIASDRFVSAQGRTNLIARLPPTEPAASNAGWIALLHHLDVVAPGTAGWSRGPFAGELDGGDLVGRGAVDDKSLGIAHLAALIDAAKLPYRRRGLLFLAVADEESGGGEGLGWLLEHHPELFTGIEAALGEGGLNRTVLGRTFFWGVEVAQKRALWLRLTAEGRPGHGSSLNPESAAHQLVRALDRLLARPPDWQLQPPVQQFFERLIRIDPLLRRQRPDAPRGALAARAVTADGPADWIPPGLWGLLLDTAQVTRLDAGSRTNVVAAEATAELDIRLLPETDAAAYRAALAATLGRGIRIETLLETAPAPASPVDTPFWFELERALAHGEQEARPAPTLPTMIPGITDSRFLRQRGIAAYGLSPFELEADAMRRVHAADERIPLDVFDRGVARMRRIVRALLAASD